MKGFGRNLSIFLFLVLFFIFYTKYTYAFVPIVPDIKLKLDPSVVSCVLIGTKYDQKSEQLSISYNNHIETYAKLVDRLESMTEKWQEWGYDTEAIEEDLDQLKTMIQEYKDDFADLESKLTIAKNACSNTNYAIKLSEAKEALKEVRRDVVDIRVLYQTEIRKNILNLKNQEIN